MKDDCIIFIHRGESWYLYYTVKQARFYHPKARIVVITDTPQERLAPYAEQLDIGNYWGGAEDLAAIYQHHSMNSREFELFCFQRWFVIRNFLQSYQPVRAIHLDSDVLVYDDLFKDFARMKGKSLGIVGYQGPFSMLIPNRSVIVDFCARIMRLFREERGTLARMYAEWTKESSHVALSDMHALRTYISTKGLSTLDLSVPFEGSIYDTVVHEPDGLAMQHGIKAIAWIGGRPHGRKAHSGEVVRLKTLHFQGATKNRILNFFTRKDFSYWGGKLKNKVRAISSSRSFLRKPLGAFKRGRRRSKDTPKTVVYFGHVPGEGAGSPIIIYRHLQRLAERGWKVFVVGEWGQEPGVCRKHGWPFLTLSLRRSLWPRFDPNRPLLRKLRVWLWAGEVDSWLGGRRPDAVLTYLSAFSDTLSLAAVGFAERYDISLATISHDDVRCFVKERKERARAHLRHQWVMRHSAVGLFASPDLAACFSPGGLCARVLRPIPEGWDQPAVWRKPGQARSQIYYAGAIWPAQCPLLVKLARTFDGCHARLVLLARRTEETAALLGNAPVDWVEPFSSNRDALAYLVRSAQGLLVSYSETVAEMPWIATSFPSKLVEYSHLGLPCAIVAPAESAVGRWAQVEDYPDFFLPEEQSSVAHWARSLRLPSAWRGLAASLRKHADGMFCPEFIHRQLEECYLPATGRNR